MSPVRRDRLAGARKPGNDRLLSDMEGSSYSREEKSFDLARARRILDARKVERDQLFLDAYKMTLSFRDSSWTIIPAPAVLEQEVGTYPRRAVETADVFAQSQLRPTSGCEIRPSVILPNRTCRAPF